jgi:LysM repeat protein
VPPTVTSIPVCSIPDDWVPYTVRYGDTLFQIGLAYGLTVDALQRANCLSSTALDVGMTLYVPPTTPVAVVIPEPTSVLPPTAGPSPTPSYTDGICTNPGSVISSPAVFSTLSGTAQFFGTATHAAFAFYKLEIRQEGASTPADFVTFAGGEEPVTNGLLGVLYTDAFPDGEYWIRLVVVDTTGNYPERCSILYRIDN